MNAETSTNKPEAVSNTHNTSRLHLSRGQVWLLMVVITLLGAFLRFYKLGGESLWDGEIFTLLFAQYDWTKIFQSISTFSAHPPLWFALSKVVIGNNWSEMVLRLPAAFAGVLSVPAVFALGKRFFDARVAVLCAALMAFSPLDVIFSQNARNYALFVLLTILLVYGAVRAVIPEMLSTREQLGRYSKPLLSRIAVELYYARWWILFGSAALAGLYTHYLFVLPFVGTVLAMVVRFITDAVSQAGSWRKVGAWWNHALVASRPFILTLILIVACYMPWVPSVGSAFIGRQLTRENANADESAALTIDDGPRLLKDFSGNATWGLVLFGAFAVVGLGRTLSGKKRESLYWVGLAILLPIGVMILLAPRRLPAKYLIYLLPAYLLFAAAGIMGLADFLTGRVLKSERVVFVPALVLVSILAVATIPNMPYWNGRQSVFTGKGWSVVDDWKAWRSAAASVTSRAAPGDFVLFPAEARALTARSVVPYFSDSFFRRLYSAPPTGRVWWVSESKDVPPENAAVLQGEKDFSGNLVVQELKYAPEFVPAPLANPSFEDELNNWERTKDTAIWTQDTKIAAQGKASGRLTLRRAQFSSVSSQNFPVTPGKLYRVTAYVKNPTFGFYTTSPQLFVDFYNKTNAPPKRTRLPTVLSSDVPGWVLMAVDGIVPADAVNARIEFAFRDYARALGPTSWIDNVQAWVEK